MDTTVNKTRLPRLMVLGPDHANLVFNLHDEQDRLFYIDTLKRICPKNAGSQLLIDQAIIAAGGTPEPGFGVNYELMQQ